MICTIVGSTKKRADRPSPSLQPDSCSDSSAAVWPSGASSLARVLRNSTRGSAWGTGPSYTSRLGVVGRGWGSDPTDCRREAHEGPSAARPSRTEAKQRAEDHAQQQAEDGGEKHQPDERDRGGAEDPADSDVSRVGQHECDQADEKDDRDAGVEVQQRPMGLASKTRTTRLGGGLRPGDGVRRPMGRLCRAGRWFGGIHVALHLSVEPSACLGWTRRAPPAVRRVVHEAAETRLKPRREGIKHSAFKLIKRRSPVAADARPA